MRAGACARREAVRDAYRANGAEHPGDRGDGGCQLYFVDRYGAPGSIWDVNFVWLGEREPRPPSVGLYYIDHLTHNVRRGNMDAWAEWYRRLFDFREIRFFPIEGKLTGLVSRAMVSLCGRIRIPINQGTDDGSQIEEFLRDYRGEGIQHVALGARDIFAAVESLRARGLRFLEPPLDTYYERVASRIPATASISTGCGTPGPGRRRRRRRWRRHQGAAADLHRRSDRPDLLRTDRAAQRRGLRRNFRALFESIEEDQIRRGVLKPKPA